MSQLYDGHCRRKALKGLFCFCCFHFFSFFLSLLLLLFCYWYSFLGIHHLRYSHKMNSCHGTPAPTIKPAFFFSFFFDIVQVVTSYWGQSTEHSKSCAGAWKLHFPSQWRFCAKLTILVLSFVLCTPQYSWYAVRFLHKTEEGDLPWSTKEKNISYFLHHLNPLTVNPYSLGSISTLYFWNIFHSYQTPFFFLSDKCELTAGSDEKKAQRSPAGDRTWVFRLPVGRSNHWATKPRQELRANVLPFTKLHIARALCPEVASSSCWWGLDNVFGDYWRVSEREQQACGTAG